MLIRTKDDKIYQVLQAGPWQGLQEVKVDKIEEPVNRWTGPKRTLAQHRQVLSFFAWTYKEFKDEAMVHWFLNTQEGRWEPMVLPQRGVGMTVKILEDHANYIPTFQRLGTGWEIGGTDHHHCSGSAFQSSVDHTDEKGKEGLHITIGDLGKDRYSIHSRSSFRHTIRPVFLSDWYEVPAELQCLPLDIQEQALEFLLCVPSAVEFPEWWKENVIRQTSTVTVYDTRKNTTTGHWSYSGSGSYASNRLRTELEDFRKEHSMGMWDFHDWLEKLRSNEHLMGLLKALSWCYSDIDDAIELTEAELKTGAYDEEVEDELDEILVDSSGNPILDKNGDFIPAKFSDDLNDKIEEAFGDYPGGY